MDASSGTVTARVSRRASGPCFEDLPPEVVREVKRHLLDSPGCALGGFLQHDATIARDVPAETAGPGPATIVGSGERLDVWNLVQAESVREIMALTERDAGGI